MTCACRNLYLMPLDRSLHHCAMHVWYSTKNDANSSVRVASLFAPKSLKIHAAVSPHSCTDSKVVSRNVLASHDAKLQVLLQCDDCG